MKKGYPVIENGGVSQQPYELKSSMQRKGIQRMLCTAKVGLEGLQLIVDLGCRNGDTTLGLLEAAPSAKVVAVEEVLDALALAKFKFGIATSGERKAVAQMMGDSLSSVDIHLQKFRADAASTLDRVEFVKSNMNCLGFLSGEADLVAGFQLLHWLDEGHDGLPKREIMKSISKCLRPGGTFISGTSTAFVEIDTTKRIDGMSVAEYSIDHHPFFSCLYTNIADALGAQTEVIPAHAPPLPSLKLDALAGLLESVGFKDVEIGAFLVTPGRELVLTEVSRIRPKHQGRLEGVPEPRAAEIVREAITAANEYFSLNFEPTNDPRNLDRNIYDAVPYVKATKA